jgi:FlaA1/EpsC-like NDP-sugar epimerase
MQWPPAEGIASMSSVHWHGYRVAAWAGQVLLAVAIMVVAFMGNWQGVLGLAFFLIAAVAFVMMEDRLPTLFDLLFVVAALINAGGWVWNLYDTVWGYDEAAHAFTIFAVTLALGYLAYGALLSSFHAHRLLFVLAIASFGITIGALWELLEWTYEVMTPGNFLLGLNDAMIDLLMDSIGAVFAGWLSLWALHEHARTAAQ